ncbi:hypothetical protein [Aliarcobacter cryaerophilus]|uniref:hypothetical protein n=1 Tax=Aliarcobacter cryaerophilus TaxID=28198 RepID=UPI003DA57423|nr:hypothetical protein [Aliarcobacter cryaerophilus]
MKVPLNGTLWEILYNSNLQWSRNVHKNGLPKNQKELKENTQNYMESLQKNPQKVANFFLHPSVKYAS